jgi:hypothetical protein
LSLRGGAVTSVREIKLSPGGKYSCRSSEDLPLYDPAPGRTYRDGDRGDRNADGAGGHEDAAPDPAPGSHDRLF